MKNSMIYKKISCVLSFLLVVTLLVSCNKTVVVTDGFAEGEIFRINTLSCDKNEMNIYLANMANAYEKTFGEQIWTTSAGDMTIEDALLKFLISWQNRRRFLYLQTRRSL